jgi:small-conductance mechanosensitive channel
MKMLSSITFSDERILAVAVPLAIAFITTIIGYILRQILFKSFTRWAQKTETQIDDIILESIKTPSILWLVMLGLYVGVAFSNLPERAVLIIGRILFILGALSVTLALANMLASITRVYSNRISPTLPGISLTENIIRVFVLCTGVLVILNSLGVSITPILATLGVGGLAVALALQDTLSNLFAGFHISLNKMLNVGDYIRLETGEEGYVMDITWRTTKIRMLSDNVILVPNAKIAQTIITNYYFPGKDLSVSVNIGVHYNSNLDEVERITCEVAKETMRDVPGGIAEFTPSIRYNELGDSCVKFSVNMRAKEFADQYLIKHEFIKRLHQRYKKEGIVIPYPVMAINYSQEGAK